MIKYRIICPLNDNLTTFRVKCTEDDKLYIKKILDRPQFEIYKIIQEKDYDGVPKIKELFYSPENDKYILYEECVPGYTIDELFKTGTQFSKKFVIKMATALCNILKPIHNDNLIHRDISPNNVMYSQIEDKFYLIDFGNSRLNKINTPKDTVFAGTPIFMAPEQGGVGTQSDNRTDIYAIGMLMKFMLTKNTTDKKSKIRGRLGKIIKKCTQSEIASRYKNVDKLKFKLSMIKVDDFLFPFKMYLYILIGVIFILPTIITVFFDLNNMIHMYTDIRRYNLVNPIQESTGYVRSNREQEHICDLIVDRNIDGARKILDSHTEKSSTDIVLYSQIYEVEGDYDKAATVILDYLKDNDSGTAVRMYNRLKHLKPHCSADISEQITPYEN